MDTDMKTFDWKNSGTSGVYEVEHGGLTWVLGTVNSGIDGGITAGLVAKEIPKESVLIIEANLHRCFRRAESVISLVSASVNKLSGKDCNHSEWGPSDFSSIGSDIKSP